MKVCREASGSCEHLCDCSLFGCEDIDTEYMCDIDEV